MTAQPSSQAEREDERVSVPRRYVQHLIVCDLNMRMGAKCQCGLSAPGVVRPDREHAPDFALTHPEVYDLANATPRSMPEEVVEAIWKRACEGREGYCSSDLQDAAGWAISEAFRLAEQAARSATLPAGYQWSDGNREKFDFGRDTAAAAIRLIASTPHG